MNSEKIPFLVHLFVCTNERQNKQSCAGSGGVKLREDVKARLKEALPGGSVRVNAAGCLGFCERGIVAMVYPHGQMFCNLKADDVDQLVASVVQLAQGRSSN